MASRSELQPHTVHYPDRTKGHTAAIRRLARTLTLDTFFVLATCAGALLAACIHLHNSSIWYDEAITLLTTSGHGQFVPTLGMSQFQPTANLEKITSELYNEDVHPPLYFWTLAIWRTALGGSLEVARSLSALFTVGTLALLYQYARKLKLRWPWIPVAIYALSAVGLRYAYNARPYAMASFLIVLTLFLAQKRSKWTGISAAASIATHYFAALCVGPILIFECARAWRQKNRSWAILTAVTFILGCLPLLPLLRVQIGARPDQYPGFGRFTNELWSLLKGSMESVMPSTWLPHWGFALWVAAFFLVLGCWRARKTAAALPFTYLAFLGGFLLMAVITNKSIDKMPVDYYVGLAVPVMALLLGFAVNALPRASSLLALAILAGTVTTVSMTKSPDYRHMVQHIRSQCSECPILVVDGYVGAIPACVLYEDKGKPVFPVNANDSALTIAARVGNPKQAVFVPSNEPPAAGIEHALLQTYSATWKNGYFLMDLSHPREPSVPTVHNQLRVSAH
jgi:Dolichyl-phosphate-mannose-protein mannosyltransferase